MVFVRKMHDSTVKLLSHVVSEAGPQSPHIIRGEILGGQSKCTTRGHLKMYQGSAGT